MKYLTNIDLNKNQLVQARIENLAAFPGTPVLGQIFYHTGDNTIYQYDGVGPSGPSGGWTSLTTSLGYTSSATNGIVTCDTGSDATILAATGTTAGLLLPADFTKLAGIEAGAEVNVGTNIEQGLRTATLVPITSSTGTGANLDLATTTLAGTMSAADKTKLDAIEALADVTDTANVAGAGAVMEADTSTALMQFVLDEDNMLSNSATKLATQQSIKKYVDDQVGGAITGALIYKEGYAASAPPPTGIAIKKGFTYTVTAITSATGATFWAPGTLAIGDMIIAEQDNPTLAAHWTAVEKNIPDIVDASETAKGIIEIASTAEVTTGTDTVRALTPAKLTSITKLGTVTVGNVTAVVSQATAALAGKVELATITEATTGTDTVRAVTPAGLSAAISSSITATKYVANIGNGALTAITITAATHGLGTSGDFIVQVREVATGDLVIPDVNLNSSTGAVTISFNVAPTTNQYRVVIKS